jgi:hypothetical protein
LKLIVLACVAALLAGCSMELPKMPELGFNWVSREGDRSQEQLYQDQADCRRQVGLHQPITGQPGSGWGASEMREFDDCMRSKGWVKK